MAGAAVTIAVMSLAACNTMGVKVDIPSAILLVFLTAISAAGASGVAGGSLLLIPLACSLFGQPALKCLQVAQIVSMLVELAAVSLLQLRKHQLH